MVIYFILNKKKKIEIDYYSDAPIDLKLKSHMICDLLNLISLPCLDTFKQINYLQSQTNKQVSFFLILTIRSYKIGQFLCCIIQNVQEILYIFFLIYKKF